MLPYAVMMTTGSEGSKSSAARRTSMPEPCGRFRSVRTAEKRDLASSASASAKLAAGTATCFMRARAVSSISRSSGLSSTRRIGSITWGICNRVISNRKWKAVGASGFQITNYKLLNYKFRAQLFKYAGGHAGLAGLFLKAFQFLAGSVQCLFLSIDLPLLLPGVFGVFPGIAELLAGIGIVGCSPDTRLMLHYIKLPLQQRDLVLLRVNLGLPFLCLKLRFFRRRGLGLIFRVAGLGGRLCRRIAVSGRSRIRAAYGWHGVIVNDARGSAGFLSSTIFPRDVAQRRLILLCLLRHGDRGESTHESYCEYFFHMPAILLLLF